MTRPITPAECKVIAAAVRWESTREGWNLTMDNAMPEERALSKSVKSLLAQAQQTKEGDAMTWPARQCRKCGTFVYPGTYHECRPVADPTADNQLAARVERVRAAVAEMQCDACRHPRKGVTCHETTCVKARRVLAVLDGAEVGHG